MNGTSEANFCIYRDGRRRVLARALIHGLLGALAKLRRNPVQDDEVGSALLRAGELECALYDAGLPQSRVASSITDALASRACGGLTRFAEEDVSNSARDLLGQVGDSALSVSRPEGFAYYALHPLNFADLVSQVELTCDTALVVGVRTIGTTLSAVVRAELQKSGIAAERTTVRPTGHPYDRQTYFTPEQRQIVRTALRCSADFFVCDEGPGRSGSSLLSVAEALQQEGVARERITILCSHEPQVDGLCTTDGARRWKRYKSLASGAGRRIPSRAGEYIGGGQWRRFFVAQGQPWPAAWPQMERMKYLDSDGRSVLKFQGHGHYGDAVAARDEILAGRGFGAPYLGREQGFGAHALVNGQQPVPGQLPPELLRRMAEYCAWRAEAFPSAVEPQDINKLQEITQSNLEQEFGVVPKLRLEVVKPAVCDGRMHPSRWRGVEGRWLKLDGSTHGDDHFFPGPTDIAWDLAGTCVEWQLPSSARIYLLDQYEKQSGDNIKLRIDDYELSYAAFRMAWSKMAAASVTRTDDGPRLSRDYVRYRQQVEEFMAARDKSYNSFAA